MDGDGVNVDIVCYYSVIMGAVEHQFISWDWVNIYSDPLKVNNCQVSHRMELRDFCALRLALRSSDVLMARSSVPPPQAARLRRPRPRFA